jgi:hypothetical protein
MISELSSMLLSLTPKDSDLSSLLLDLLLKLPFPLLCSPNFLPQFNQALTNRFVLDAPIQLFKCAQAAQISVVQSSHIKRSHDL